MSGTLALTCAARERRSYIASVRYDGLLRTSRPRCDDDGAHVVLAHIGPGIIGGDNYATGVRVEGGAALTITGQMATPVYARGGPSSMHAAWNVAADATLVVRGEPLMLDRNARHDVHAAIDVASGASATFADIVTVAEGACARLRTTARIAGRLVARDACDLYAQQEAIATVLFVDDRAPQREAFARAAQAILDATPDARGGVGATNGAVLVRATSARVWTLQRVIDELTKPANRRTSEVPDVESGMLSIG